MCLIPPFIIDDWIRLDCLNQRLESLLRILGFSISFLFLLSALSMLASDGQSALKIEQWRQCLSRERASLSAPPSSSHRERTLFAIAMLYLTCMREGNEVAPCASRGSDDEPFRTSWSRVACTCFDVQSASNQTWPGIPRRGGCRWFR